MAKDGSYVLVDPGGGKTPPVGRLQLTYKVRAADCGGSFAALELVLPPATLVKPHRHSREDEFTMVLDGTVSARVGDRFLDLAPGSYLVKPRGIPHALWNGGSVPARVVEIISPAGFEDYFEKIEPILREHGPEWTEKFYGLADQYGITLEDAWVDELSQKYGVKL
jgi:mannose-6-phosphate isomerase-like protein (cupin superfamily)